MIHDRQRLPLRFEALHHRLVVHARLDQLDGDLPPHWRGLFGQPDLAHATLAKLAQELKMLGKELSRLQPAARKDPIQIRDRSVRRRWRLKKRGLSIIAAGEQGFNFLPQGSIGQTGATQESGTLIWLQFLGILEHITNLLPTFWCHDLWATISGSRAAGRADLLKQPSPRGSPVSLDRPGRQLEQVRRFFDGKTAEESQLHNAALLLVEFSQFVQSVVESGHIHSAALERQSVQGYPIASIRLAVLRLRAYSTRICRINWAQMARK
jgi:hypothetical protein